MQRETTMERRMLADVHRSDVQKKKYLHLAQPVMELCVFSSFSAHSSSLGVFFSYFVDFY